MKPKHINVHHNIRLASCVFIFAAGVVLIATLPNPKQSWPAMLLGVYGMYEGVKNFVRIYRFERYTKTGENIR